MLDQNIRVPQTRRVVNYGLEEEEGEEEEGDEAEEEHKGGGISANIFHLSMLRY